MLKAGASATALDGAGVTPLARAVGRGHANCARQLLAMADAVSDGDFHGCVDLARRGNWPIDAPTEVVENGAVLRTGPTPLVAAATRGDVDAVALRVQETPYVFRFFSTLEARISVTLGPIRLLLGPLIISARVLEI